MGVTFALYTRLTRSGLLLRSFLFSLACLLYRDILSGLHRASHSWRGNNGCCIWCYQMVIDSIILYDDMHDVHITKNTDVWFSFYYTRRCLHCVIGTWWKYVPDFCSTSINGQLIEFHITLKALKQYQLIWILNFSKTCGLDSTMLLDSQYQKLQGSKLSSDIAAISHNLSFRIKYQYSNRIVKKYKLFLVATTQWSSCT